MRRTATISGIARIVVVAAIGVGVLAPAAAAGAGTLAYTFQPPKPPYTVRPDSTWRNVFRTPPATCSSIEAQYADAVPTADNLAGIKQATVCLVNDFRASHGVAALSVDSNLTNAAQYHSDDMMSRQYFSHDHPAGAPTPSQYYPLWGENIAWGSGAYGTPRNVVNGPECGWTTEPHTSGPCTSTTTGHRDNILNAHFTAEGLGVAVGTYHGYQNAAMYTQDFGGR